MQATSELPGAPGGWSRRDSLWMGALILALLALLGLRVRTRRVDSSRTPLRPDILVLHVDELRADAVPPEALAADLGLEQPLIFSQAFAQSSDGRRSALSALRGDLSLNLDERPGPGSLPVTLRGAGWRTILLAPPSLAAAAGPDFDQAGSGDRAGLPGALRAALGAGDGPIFAFVQVPPEGPPLHATTTNAAALRAAYRARVEGTRGLLTQLVAAFYRPDHPQLLVLLGASGAELGEHPEDPEHLRDTRLRVPWIMGLRGGTGLPHGRLDALVQGADLAPTLLDLVDLRPRGVRDRDGVDRDGVSLEPLMQGWTPPPVHERLFFAGPGEAAVRTRGWKLLAAVDPPWRVRRIELRLHALDEDPGERTDLSEGRPLGPVGASLLGALEARLARPDAVTAGR